MPTVQESVSDDFSVRSPQGSGSINPSTHTYRVDNEEEPAYD